MPVFDKFEEYKLFIEDTARFSERRQTVGNMFVAVNTLLLTAIAFLVRDSGARDYGLLVTVLPIPLVIAGFFVCVWWRQIIFKYKIEKGPKVFERQIKGKKFELYNDTVVAYRENGKEIFRTTVEEPVYVRPDKHANSI